MRRVIVAGLLALGLGACAPNVGPEGLAVGGPCVDEFDCVTGSYCLSGAQFPNGTCTTNCRGHGDCRGDSLCVDVEGGVCLLPCEEDLDCGRTGYSCGTMSARGEAGDVSVCFGP